MKAVTVQASKGKTDAIAIIVGFGKVKMPSNIAALAAKMATGDVGGAQTAYANNQLYILLHPKSDVELVGGEAWRIMGSELVAALRGQALTSCQVQVSGKNTDVQSLVEGIVVGDYQFTTCRSGKAAKRKMLTVKIPGFSKEVKAGTQVGECQNLARELCDLPGNLMNPKEFVKRAKKELTGLGLTIKVVQGVEACRRANFPGLAQVGMAGSQPPAMLEVQYKPKGKKSKNTYAMVGKGVTFDSGGISLKPGAGMWKMKGDMGGAAAVLGAIKLIALQKLDVTVSAYCALAENMPDQHAQRPGDIYKARNGKFIHVDNTDAEGRLVLSDVLTYACEKKPTHLVDAATLTGACLVALGPNIAGLMSNDDGFAKQVRQAGQDVGEELWPLPLYNGYRKLLDHPHADINNTGGRFGGTITAGIFLSEFIGKNVKWAHCDIAGPAMMGGAWRYYDEGNTGFAVRTFARLAKCLS